MKIGAMILVVQALWHPQLTKVMADGALQYFASKKIPTEHVQVPGSLEIPLAIKWAWSKAQRSQEALDGVVACGVVVKGETYHFEIVAVESARALTQLSLELRLPIGNAILTTYDFMQASARADGRLGNKGAEAAEAVHAMLNLKKTHSF